ncbi:unnamed protein product [Adineta steineri]|uniref:Uncharacterized protein n=1 Tax=Adineta steineri TaxID=433720 RepID=A0A819I0E2_9BILA|nr:unnamed protein product [Adineta steineri]
MINNEELVGGCCVCSDDQGFSNNALVYCDGKGCTVACHTACYGIVSIPDGDWYCRRCEAGEIRAPCRLCPTIEGAMKRTSDDGWAHVICALYIPEVSFGNNSTMEPIILSKIPSTRFQQICSLCKKNGRTDSDAMKGACCECTVKNCSQLFHVTCAQQAGLLYEDVRKNNCQYPIYCEQHQPKFSKFLRQIPPFRYKSSEQKHNSTSKSLIAVTKQKLNDETSQNPSQVDPLMNLSQFVELNKEEGSSLTSSNQNQPSTDITKSSNTNIEPQLLTSKCTNDDTHVLEKKIGTPKIKTEENDIDYPIIKKPQIHKDEQLRKKRQHSNEGGPRPVGRPPKKTLVTQEKQNNTSLPVKTEESQEKNDRIHINFYPRRPLTNSSTTEQPSQQQRLSTPQTLEEFLEQEWESTSDFLLQQTMPHDVSSLLSCLYQFKSENASLQKKIDELKHRRDSLRVTNSNLRRKLSEIIPINDTTNDVPRLPINHHHQSIIKTSKSPNIENQRKLTQMTSSEIDYFSNHSTSSSSSLPYESINPYTMIKNERIPPPPPPPTNGLSLELLSQILTTNGPQLFAPTWNISNFGYANFPGANAISLSEQSIIRSYPPFE